MRTKRPLDPCSGEIKYESAEGDSHWFRGTYAACFLHNLGTKVLYDRSQKAKKKEEKKGRNHAYHYIKSKQANKQVISNVNLYVSIHNTLTIKIMSQDYLFCMTIQSPKMFN